MEGNRSTVALALLRCLTLINEQQTTESDGDSSSEGNRMDEKSRNYFQTSAAPRACLLFSPSVEYPVEGDAHDMNTHRNSVTDYCERHMAAWGTACIRTAE